MKREVSQTIRSLDEEEEEEKAFAVGGQVIEQARMFVAC